VLCIAEILYYSLFCSLLFSLPPPALKFTGRRLVQGEINFLKSTAFADKERKNQ